MLPCGAGPLVLANFTSGSTGPEMEANTQSAPLLSCQLGQALPGAALGALGKLIGLGQGSVVIGSA